METTTYYSNIHVAVTSEYVRIGQHSFPSSAIESGEVGSQFFGAFGRWAAIFLGSLLALDLVAFVITFFRGALAVFRGISSFESVYAQDWLDFIFPVAFATTSLCMLYLLLVFKGQHLNVTLKLRAEKISEGTTIKWMSPPAGDGTVPSAAALGDALRKVAPRASFKVQGKVLDAENAPPPESTLYWDGNTIVTYDYVQYRRNRLPVVGVTHTEIVVDNLNPGWLQVLRLVQGILVTLLFLVFVGTRLITDPPMVRDGVILFPRFWLISLGLISLWRPIVIGHIKDFRRRNKRSVTYTVKVYGNFGRYNPSVIFPTDILYTSDEEHAKNVRAAVEHAMNRPTEHPLQHLSQVAITGYQGT